MSIVPATPRIVQRILILPAVMMTLVVSGTQATAAALPSEGAGDPGPYVTQMDHFNYLPLAFNVPPAGVIQGALIHDGMQREYILYVPTSYTGHSPVPLILNYHAYARDAMVQMAYGDFRPVAERTGAIVVHPQGAILDGVRRWNVGGIYTHPLADDIGFSEALIDLVSDIYQVDQTRIYGTGFSNGGYMSYLLACQLSGRIAAVAAVAGSMTPEMHEDCQPVRPLALLHIHGLDDAVVPYGGDDKSLAVDEAIAYWVAANGNDPTPAIRPRPDSDPSDGSTVTEFVYGGGPNGVITELLRIDGGGHSWPGAANSGPGTNYDIDASSEIWDFFARYDINGPRATSDR